jgi:hypothetical protein
MWFQSVLWLPRHVQQCSNDAVKYVLCYMHQINAVTSLKVLPIWKVFENFDCFLKGMFVRVGVSFLFCPFIVPFLNTTSMFFTISNTSFWVYYFGALSFSTVLSKCIFILWYLCFLGKNYQCHMYTNFLDDGRYTDAVPSTQIGHAPLFPLVCPDNVKPLEHYGYKRIWLHTMWNTPADTDPTYGPLHSRVLP